MIGKMTKTALMLWCEVEGNLFGDDMWEERTRKGAQKDYQLLIKRLSDMSLIDCEIFCEGEGEECAGCIRKDLVEIRGKVEDAWRSLSDEEHPVERAALHLLHAFISWVNCGWAAKCDGSIERLHFLPMIEFLVAL